MKRGVILVAGGKGLRMGNDLPKQFIPILGKPILMHTLEVFHQWDKTATLIVVLPEAHQAYWTMLTQELSCRIPHQIANGGTTRFQSVRNGLAFLTDCDLIGVHDGVRPLVSHEVIESCFKKAENIGAAIPVTPMVESIRKCDKNGSHSVDRDDYCVVQTPQVFRSDWLVNAYQQPFRNEFTDDASIVESIGKMIHLVPGNIENIKITTPLDLVIAENRLS